jgi:hypothetical protein
VELQAFGLGLDVSAYDPDDRKSVVGEKAELVCRSPFVAAPVCFFGDDDENRNIVVPTSRRKILVSGTMVIWSK